MDKRFWAIIGIIGAIFIGILLFTGNKKDVANDPSNAAPTNHVMGKTDSKVKLVEYGDYQCPVCGGYYPTVKEVVEKYKDRIAFQFRNLPLTQIHQHALAAARAAEAANAQGKFWEMNDILFTNYQTWPSTNDPRATFEQFARQLSLDVSKFDTDFESSKVNQLVNADLAAFKKTGEKQETPTFFLNGKKIPLTQLRDGSGRPSVDKFSTFIDAELAKQNQ